MSRIVSAGSSFFFLFFGGAFLAFLQYTQVVCMSGKVVKTLELADKMGTREGEKDRETIQETEGGNRGHMRHRKRREKQGPSKNSNYHILV